MCRRVFTVSSAGVVDLRGFCCIYGVFNEFLLLILMGFTLLVENNLREADSLYMKAKL
jgi:hypothetical protein